MNPKSFALAVLTGAVFAVALLAPPRSSGQAANPADEAALTALLNEVAAQQAVLTENQAKIDAKIASTA